MMRQRFSSLFRLVIPLLLTIVLYYGIVFAASMVQAAPAAQANGQAYVVKSGDSLYKISGQIYGDPTLWPKIQEATNAKSQEDSSFATISNPRQLSVGQKLWIPDLALAQQPAVMQQPTAMQQPEKSQNTITITVNAPVAGVSAPIDKLSFVDNGDIRTGSFVLQLAPIAAPPAGSHYELWLSSDTSDSPLDLGAFTPDNGQVNFAGNSDQPLLATYDRALISLEPDGETDPAISQQIVFSSTMPAALVTPLRQLLFQNERTDKGFLSGASDQVKIAVQHTGFLLDALTGNDFAKARVHAEHVVNMLDGKAGPNFNDWNRDGQAQNPGDDFGLRAYVEEAYGQMGDGLAEITDSQALREQSQPALTALETAQATVAQAEEQALKIFATDTITEAQSVADELQVMMEEMQKDITIAYTTTLQMAELHFTAR